MEGMRLIFASILALGMLSAADLKLGKPLAAKESMTLATLLAHPDEYVGKTVQVKGKIVDVCQMMGCWMDLTNDAGQKLRIKVNDGEIEFPKNGAGKIAVVEGKLTKSELTKEQAIARAKETAEDRGKAFDPASVTGPQTIYQIEGTGAVILNN
jgi:hypothetical protein